MILNLILLLVSGFLSYWFYRNIKKQGPLWIAKGSLQIGILILFMGGFLELFFSLPSSPYLKTIFCLVYLWFTVGVNVNLIIPLISLIEKEIERNK